MLPQGYKATQHALRQCQDISDVTLDPKPEAGQSLRACTIFRVLRTFRNRPSLQKQSDTSPLLLHASHESPEARTSARRCETTMVSTLSKSSSSGTSSTASHRHHIGITWGSQSIRAHAAGTETKEFHSSPGRSFGTAAPQWSCRQCPFIGGSWPARHCPCCSLLHQTHLCGEVLAEGLLHLAISQVYKAPLPNFRNSRSTSPP